MNKNFYLRRKMNHFSYFGFCDVNDKKKKKIKNWGFNQLIKVKERRL